MAVAGVGGDHLRRDAVDPADLLHGEPLGVEELGFLGRHHDLAELQALAEHGGAAAALVPGLPAGEHLLGLGWR